MLRERREIGGDGAVAVDEIQIGLLLAAAVEAVAVQRTGMALEHLGAGCEQPAELVWQIGARRKALCRT